MKNKIVIPISGLLCLSLITTLSMSNAAETAEVKIDQDVSAATGASPEELTLLAQKKELQEIADYTIGASKCTHLQWSAIKDAEEQGIRLLELARQQLIKVKAAEGALALANASGISVAPEIIGMVEAKTEAITDIIEGIQDAAIKSIQENKAIACDSKEAVAGFALAVEQLASEIKNEQDPLIVQQKTKGANYKKESVMIEEELAGKATTRAEVTLGVIQEKVTEIEKTTNEVVSAVIMVFA